MSPSPLELYGPVTLDEMQQFWRSMEGSGKQCSKGHVVSPENSLPYRNRHGNLGFRCRPCSRGRKDRSNARLKPGRKRKISSKSVDSLIAGAVSGVASNDKPDTIVQDFATRIATLRLTLRGGDSSDSSPEMVVEHARAVADIWEAIDKLGKDESRRPWAYLQVKPEARHAWDAFSAALEKANNTRKNLPNCDGRASEFSDYDDDEPPTVAEARELCENKPCPLFALCQGYADKERPAHGIWAGKRYDMGVAVTE